MFKTVLTLLFLIASTYTHKARALQAKKYTPMEVPQETDDWAEARSNWYELELARLAAQTKFHTSEFKRYNRQQQLNDDRKKNEADASKNFAQKARADFLLTEQYNIDLDNINAHVNYNKNMRNPANLEEDRAKRIFDEESTKAWNKVSTEMKNPKIPKQPEAVVKRNLQEKSGMTAQQSAQVKKMKDAWAKRQKSLQNEIDLNLKFHAVEFEEFVLDTHRCMDIKAIMESKLPLNEKRTLLWKVWSQYDQLKAPSIKLINDSNNARNQAQNTVNNDQNTVEGLYRANKGFTFATGTK